MNQDRRNHAAYSDKEGQPFKMLFHANSSAASSRSFPQ